MEILPGVHHLKQPLEGIWTAQNLLVGERAALIDTGLPVTPRAILYPYWKHIGFTPSRLAHIINTHSHVDHVGGNFELKEVCGAQLMAHRLAAPAITDPNLWFQQCNAQYPAYSPYTELSKSEIEAQWGRGTDIDWPVEDGDTIDLGDRRLHVIHTPGHSPGAICLYEEETNTLFTGDAIQGLGTTATWIPLYLDVEAYRTSLHRVQRLTVETLVAAHPYQPFDNSWLSGQDVSRLLDISLGFITECEERMLDTLASYGEPLRIGQIAERICRSYGFEGYPFISIITIGAHLDKLLTEERVIRIESQKEHLWILE